MFYAILEGSNVLEAILKLFFEASDGLSRPSPPAVGDSHLRNVDKACDKIHYSESC